MSKYPLFVTIAVNSNKITMITNKIQENSNVILNFLSSL